MNKIVYCVFLKMTTEGLGFQPYPGELGKKIFENISKQAWICWQKKQTMLINEKKLNMTKIKDRNILEQEMIKFLFKNENVYVKRYNK